MVRVKETSDSDLADLRLELALASRVMAARGLVDDVLGHISYRVGQDRLLVRCRGPQEQGLLFTQPSDFCVVGLDGEMSSDTDRRPPVELPIHTELLRERPGVNVVVHAHPRDTVAAELAGLPLLPMIGAFDIPAMRLASDGIATYPRSVLISTDDLASEMNEAMGENTVCVLRGHGLVTTGTSIAQAVLRALQVNSLAGLTLDVARSGGTSVAIPAADQALLPDLGSDFNEKLLWHHHLARLRLDGLDLIEGDS